MKKLFFVIIFICFPLILVAQDKIKFGVNGGLNYASLRGNDLAEDLAPGISYLVGVSAEFFLKENLSISANLNYENKTAKDNGNVYLIDEYGFPTMIKSDSKSIYNYLVLPVYVNYYFGKKDDFYVNGGLFLGYLLNSKFSSKNSDNDTDTTDMNKKIDAGLVFGFGKVFQLNDKNNLKLEIRENLGMLNTSDFDVYNDGTIKTNSLNLILNWNFNL
ncbi:porin family protein [Flavobacterium sp. UBA6195]|uniref:porin family protein n=1 Tax=Flavobacterium sp. UBA6195 TaxID=1946554 RepID=UPI0025C2F42A|nr:porin family protein [Flavobacterium sp. UBA6195]